MNGTANADLYFDGSTGSNCYSCDIALHRLETVVITCAAGFACDLTDFYLEARVVTFDVNDSFAAMKTVNIDGTHIGSSLSVFCGNEYASCLDVKIQCPTAPGSSCIIGCDSFEGCNPLYFYVADNYDGLSLLADEDNDNLLFECGSAEDADCQLVSMFEQVDCNATDCVIDCKETDCHRRVINASRSSSLDISCAGSTCDGSTLYCPGVHGARCTVRCLAGFCKYSQIVAETEHDLDFFRLLCGDGRCEAATITLSATTIQNVSIACDDEMACYGMDLDIESDFIDSIYLSCDAGNACRGMSFAVAVGRLNEAHVECTGGS